MYNMISDIRGPEFPNPKFDTYVKLAWDDQNLYFAGEVKDTDIWAVSQDKDTARKILQILHC